MEKQNIKAGLLLSLSSAVAVYYCHIALHSLYLAPFVAFVPLIFSLYRARNFTEVVTLSLAFSLLCGILAFYGTQTYGYSVYLFAVILVAVVYLSSFLLVAFFIRRSIAQFSILAAAAGFVLIDFAVSRMPWFGTARIAGMLSFDPVWLQFASITGHLGLSFIIIYANICFAIFIAEGKSSLKIFTSALAVICALYLYGYLQLNELVPEKGENEAAIIQGSISDQEYEEMENSQVFRRLVFERYFSITADAVKRGYKLILWPETAIRSFIGARQEITAFVKSKGIEIFGGFPFIVEGSSEQFNSVLWLDKNAGVVSRYNKNYLIPYTENEFSKGEENIPVETRFGKITTPICFEVLFPHLVRESVAKGGESIFVFSNDAGFGSAPVSALMVRQAILRAVENRRWLIRVGQSGISAEITPHGILNKRSKLFEQTVLPVEFSQEAKLSTYTRYGDWFSFVLLLILVIAGMQLREKKRG